ncbi:MAG: AraC family transcriptional regulator [Phycisphaerales bacterium]
MDSVSAFPRSVAMGVSEYSHRQGPWDMMMGPGVTPDALAAYQDVTGIIAMSYDQASLHALKQTGVPIVLTQDEDNGGLPRIGPNDPIVGRIALESFRNKGFTRVAYCGSINSPASWLRRDAFADAAEHAGMDVHVYPGNVYGGIERYADMSEQLCRWLSQLPKPVGLLAFTDIVSVTVLHFCRKLNIPVPEEIALLGVDNDALLCEMTSPRLSSIDHGARRIGYEAAALLDELMRGHRPPGKPLLVDPVGVVERQSTDTMAVDHPDLVAALKFIREHVREGITVTHVLNEVPLSRRALERGFRRALGRTVHQEILRVRIETAKHLLLHTDMTLPDISKRCGFSYSTKLSESFKRATGIPPRRFRRKFQVGTSEHEPIHPE